MSAIQLRKQTKLVKEYWAEVCSKEELVNSPMNSTFYESVTETSRTKLNNAALNSAGQTYLNAPLAKVALPETTIALQPLSASYETNVNVRLFRSASVKERRVGSLIKNYLANSEGVNASL